MYPSKTVTPDSTIRILIAEDDPIIFFYLKSVINSFIENAEVLKARNGKEAVDAARKNPHISLVLMDLGMPEMNGIDACRIIKQELGRAVPVIAQTAYGQSARESDLFDDIIYKPSEPEAIREVISKFLKPDIPSRDE